MYYAKFKIGQEKLVSELVWDVFKKFEAPDYPQEGINTFKDFIEPDILKDMVCNHDFKIYCCLENDKLVGVLAIRDKSHISLLFVHEEYHRQGIAKTLFGNALEELQTSDKSIKKITVNSSPYAKKIYEHMGFTATSEMQQQNGILFIPMVKEISH